MTKHNKNSKKQRGGWSFFSNTDPNTDNNNNNNTLFEMPSFFKSKTKPTDCSDKKANVEKANQEYSNCQNEIAVQNNSETKPKQQKTTGGKKSKKTQKSKKSKRTKKSKTQRRH